MSDGGIIVEKKIVVKAIDEVTSPLAKMNQSMSNLEQKLNQLGMKFNSGATEQTTFKSALNSTKASLSETGEATRKLDKSINGLKSKNIKVKADTTEGQEKVTQFDKNVKALQRVKPVVKPTVDDKPAVRGFQRIKNASHSAFGSIKSFVAGGLITNAATSIASHLGEWAKQGYEAAKAGTEVAERWKNLGMTEQEVKDTGNAVRDLKENSNLSGVAVGNLITRFYGFTGSVQKARELSTGVASLADKMKLSESQADAFANGLTRIETAGTVSSRSLGRMERAAPGITKALQQASGMSKKAFDDLLSSGKMTSDQFNDILTKASKDWKKNSEDWAKTPDGALHHIKTQFDDTKKALMAPLVSTSGTGLNALSKALDKLQPQFTVLGQKIADIATKFAKWLTPKHAEDLGKIVSSLARMAGVLAKGAWKAVTAPLEIIGRIINSLTGKKGDALDAVATALDHISKNKIAMGVLEGIGAILGTQFAYSKLLKISKGLRLVKDGADGLKLLGKWKLSGNIVGDVGKLVKKLTRLKNFKINPAKWFKGKLNISKFIGNGKSFSSLFKGLRAEAETNGTSVAKTFLTRFKSFGASNVGRIGTTLGGKLSAGLTMVMAGVDIFKGLHEKGKKSATDLGKGAGTLIGGAIGGVLGGPVGMTIGSILGGAIGGKLGPTMGKAANGAKRLLKDIFSGNWGDIWKSLKSGFKNMWKGLTKWASDIWKSIKDWWNGTDSSKSSSSSSHKSSSKKPSSKEIKSLGGNHYSKTDIANIREMNRAVLTYTRTLKTLKQTVKHNDPTKALNKMNKGLKSFVKDMAKSAKPLEKLTKMFKTFGKSTKTMASSIKSLTGKHGLGEFTKDLGKLNKDMKHTKVGTYFEKLAKSIKKSKLADEVKKLDTWFGGMVKDFKQLTKPLKQATKEFTSFEKTIGKLANRKTGLSKVDSDIKTLSKDLKKYNFGKVLGQQMAEADKAVGKHGFIKQFTSMMKVVEEALRSFSKDFKRYWGDTWKNLSSQAKKGLNKANRTINSKLDDIEDTGHSFERGFKRSWDNWLDDLVSAFKSGFNKLPGIAGSAMKDIVSRLNKGISGINKVIGDFGGDKKLSSISYASGTSMHSAGSAYSAHPGGMAVINDGNGPHKQELVWQPSQGWQLFAGINRHVWLEPGSQVIPGEKSHEILSRKRIPHYANGTLSDDEMDKIADAFDKNPVSASKELILKLTNWNSSKSIIPTFGKASAIAFSRGIANVLKDLLAIVQEPKNGDWGPVIRSAARKMKAHINDGFVSNLKQVIQNESGGREDRMQEIHDQNSGGNEARGLLQYTVPTFNSYAMPKFHNIMKGFHQLIAFFNNSDYANSIGWTTIWGHRKMEWLHSGPQGSRRFAFGGRVRGLQNITVGDNPEQDEFIINPYNNNALPLMKQAWQTMEAHHPELRSNENDGQFNGQVVTLLHEVVKAVNNIDMQPQLVVDEFTNAINKRNAHNWRNAYN